MRRRIDYRCLAVLVSAALLAGTARAPGRAGGNPGVPADLSTLLPRAPAGYSLDPNPELNGPVDAGDLRRASQGTALGGFVTGFGRRWIRPGAILMIVILKYERPIQTRAALRGFEAGARRSGKAQLFEVPGIRDSRGATTRPRGRTVQNIGIFRGPIAASVTVAGSSATRKEAVGVARKLFAKLQVIPPAGDDPSSRAYRVGGVVIVLLLLVLAGAWAMARRSRGRRAIVHGAFLQPAPQTTSRPPPASAITTSDASTPNFASRDILPSRERR